MEAPTYISIENALEEARIYEYGPTQPRIAILSPHLEEYLNSDTDSQTPFGIKNIIRVEGCIIEQCI
jgi:hypothetical protein